MSIQGIRQAARKALHDMMSRPAVLYLETENYAIPYGITARYHAKPGLVGDLKGTNLSYAETHDDVERLVLWCEELIPLVGPTSIPPRRSLIFFDATESYWVDNVRPVYGQTVTVEITRAENREVDLIVNPPPPPTP